jgi:hypothetical protein
MYITTGAIAKKDVTPEMVAKVRANSAEHCI